MLSVVIFTHVVYDGIHRGFLLNYSDSKCVFTYYYFFFLTFLVSSFQLIFTFITLVSFFQLIISFPFFLYFNPDLALANT